MSRKRKTREQKIISELRRKLLLQDSPLTKEEKPKFSTSNIRANLPPITYPQPENSASIQVQSDYSFLSGDLRKIAILTGLAILFQSVLYWALR